MRLLDVSDCRSPMPEHRAVISFIQTGTRGLDNVSTRLRVLECGDHLFPVSINDHGERADNSYVVSPLTTYGPYAEFEIDQLPHTWYLDPLRWIVRWLARRLDAAQIDRIVWVNNWLLSTNLYPPQWRGDEIEAMTELLVATYPDHAIGFRSLNDFSNSLVRARLHQAGYVAVPSRQVYLFDCSLGDDAPCLGRHNTRIDAKLLRTSDYRIVTGDDLSEQHFSRLEQLYSLLYLDKYSVLNPQFSARWLEAGHRDGWLEFSALQNRAGRLDAVVGWFANQQILTAPVVGYDTSLPQQLGLYRMVTSLCISEAVRRRCLLNFSSGAAHFKRLRGGRPEIEYSMVSTNHLPRRRQNAWRFLSQILEAIAVPLMKKLEL